MINRNVPGKKLKAVSPKLQPGIRHGISNGKIALILSGKRFQLFVSENIIAEWLP
jgi:hypothetical protein